MTWYISNIWENQSKKLNLKLNGTPGTRDFQSKLPKNVTINSLKTALFHILKCEVEQAVLDEDQYVTGELQIIYPNLNGEIARHYSLLSLQNGRHGSQATLDESTNMTSSFMCDNASIVHEPVSPTLSLHNNDSCPDTIITPESPTVSSENGLFVNPSDCCVQYHECLTKRIDELANDLQNLRSLVAKQNEKGLANEKASQTLDHATNPNINEQDNSDYHHVDNDMEENTPAPSNSSPSTEEQMAAYRHKHRSKFAPTGVNTPIANTAKVDVLIIGDSMTKPIVPSRLSRRRRIKCKTLPGAKIEDVFDSVFHFARDQQPDEIVIHLGTNNVAQDEKDEIVAKLISLADQITERTSAKAITLSTIIHRARETDEESSKVNDVNKAVKLLAYQRRWSVIDNDNIAPGLHLAVDGVHLNEYGVRALAQNIIAHLRGPSRDTDDRPSYVAAATASNSATNQRPRSSRTMEVPPTNQQPRAPSTRPNHPPFRNNYNQNFRRKPMGREFPRDWLDCLHTARTLLNQRT